MSQKQMKLYRAAADDYLGCSGETRCFAACKDDAQAYLDNPGFGGAVLFVLEVDVDLSTVIDARTDDGKERLCFILGMEEDEIVASGGSNAVESVHRLENGWMAEALAEAGVRWLVHNDSYPVECETWTMIVGDWADDLEMVEIESAS